MHDIFAFSDIHGMWDLYRAIINYCHEQDPEAMIIYCGDACDRGPDGYRIMKELLDNPYVVYLKGNHEDMFTKAARVIKQMFNFENTDRDHVKKVLSACRNFDYKYAAIQDSLYNGGMSTLLDWIMDDMPMDFVEHIEQLPLTLSTDTCDFCHSGGLYNTFKRVADCEYGGLPIDQWTGDAIIWNRSALNIGWTPGRTCIFGHTPTPYLEDYLDGFKWDENKEVEPYKYIGTFNPHFTGAKIDIDTGAAFTGRAFVLNVLTMKAYGFEDLDFENKDIEKHRIEKIKVIQL